MMYEVRGWKYDFWLLTSFLIGMYKDFTRIVGVI